MYKTIIVDGSVLLDEDPSQTDTITIITRLANRDVSYAKQLTKVKERINRIEVVRTPPKLEGKITDPFGTTRWYKNGVLHRDGGKPAVIYSYGYQAWFEHGKYIKGK